MIDVPPGATTVPPPVDIDVNQVMRTNPLITDFRPLPSYPLIVATGQQEPVYQGQPVGNQPPFGGIVPPIGRYPQPPSHGQNQPPSTDTGKGGGTSTHPIDTSPSPPPRVTPTPTPVIGRTLPGRAGATTRPSGRARRSATPPIIH